MRNLQLWARPVELIWPDHGARRWSGYLHTRNTHITIDSSRPLRQGPIFHRVVRKIHPCSLVEPAHCFEGLFHSLLCKLTIYLPGEENQNAYLKHGSPRANTSHLWLTAIWHGSFDIASELDLYNIIIL